MSDYFEKELSLAKKNFFETLDQLVAALHQARDPHWEQYFKDCAKMQKMPHKALTKYYRAFGGMGSFNDYYSDARFEKPLISQAHKHAKRLRRCLELNDIKLGT